MRSTGTFSLIGDHQTRPLSMHFVDFVRANPRRALSFVVSSGKASICNPQEHIHRESENATCQTEEEQSLKVLLSFRTNASGYFVYVM